MQSCHCPRWNCANCGKVCTIWDKLALSGLSEGGIGPTLAKLALSKGGFGPILTKLASWKGGFRPNLTMFTPSKVGSGLVRLICRQKWSFLCVLPCKIDRQVDNLRVRESICPEASCGNIYIDKCFDRRLRNRSA